MKHLFHHLPKLAALAAIALSASSCNRAEYAMLPKTTPYHATYHGTAKMTAPVAQKQEVAVAETQSAVVEEKNVVAEAPAAVAAAPVAAPATTTEPVAAAVAAPVAAAAKAAQPATAAAAPRKLNLMEKVAFNKVVKKVDKLASKVQFKQGSETAGTSKIGGYLRTGIILLLVGLLVSLLSGISNIFGIIGGILAIIGLIFIILWLLDEV
ncbi:hypothetical protein KBK19_07140 [Microvirga sp. STR05]|uniref:Uncharacterized protein n=1 Tax=Hymenobacter duratus TaxID=2771356 RepID=A0ABR8JJV7_9BACT|nr:hypothetical protein [Hymenobacter duratus]MBD2714804.1 hypothetical protein [Hymenobacter duratus]MBR7949709.1 hypothetical protein [Microvirga sp. STR05]